MEHQRPLSESDKRTAFIAATKTFAKAEGLWRQRIAEGMSDAQLVDALNYELSIFGGRSATKNCPSITYQRAGLKIWAGWHSFNLYQEKPIFEGKASIQMAREIYGIKDPSDNQPALL